MSDKKSQPQQKAPVQTQVPGKVISMDDYRCRAESCKSKSTKAGFCDEHFVWFKAGLITKEGARAADFEKKFYQWQAAQKKAA